MCATQLPPFAVHVVIFQVGGKAPAPTAPADENDSESACNAPACWFGEILLRVAVHPFAEPCLTLAVMLAGPGIDPILV